MQIPDGKRASVNPSDLLGIKLLCCMGSAEGWVSVLEERKPLCCSWAGNYFTLQRIRGIAGKSELAVVLADGLEKRWAEQRHQRSSAGP